MRICFSILLLPLAVMTSAPAVAETPEASFAGIWRIIGAIPAPWVEPHTLSRDEAPLLQHNLLFADAEVKGTPPLACRAAKYATTAIEPLGLFQGNLPPARAPDIAAELKLQAPQTTTLRVACSSGSFDYHLDSDGRLLVALDNVIYTLQRPEGDPAKIEPGAGGPSFDCLQAKTAGEKVICRDADLSRADLAMAVAYSRLRQTATPQSFATILAAQRAWLAYVSKICGAGTAMSEDPAVMDRLRNCLAEQYQDRAGRLSGIEVIRQGALTLEPRMRFFAKRKPATEDSDIYPWMGGGPPAVAFNAYVEKLLKLRKRRMDDPELFPFGNDIPEGMTLYARRTYSVARFDPRIVSLQIASYDYTGGAHEVLRETSLNWDLLKARPLSTDDLFIKRKNWRQFVTDYCLRELQESFGARDAPGPDRSAVHSVAADGKNWLFAANHATVHFPAYSIASFAAGEFDVDIPYTVLRPYLKTDAAILE